MRTSIHTFSTCTFSLIDDTATKVAAVKKRGDKIQKKW